MADEKLPVPSSVVARVVQAAADPSCSLKTLAEIISHDPVLSAETLRAVNTPFYGLRTRVSSVANAVPVMGLARVRNLVLRLAVQELVPDRAAQDFPLSAFWESSLHRAAASSCLSNRLGIPAVKADAFFTVGLCQDLGILVRLLQAPRLSSRLAAALRMPGPVRLYLEKQWGPGHDGLGAELLEKWGLPDELVVPIRYHHWPEGAPQEHRPAALVAAVAESIADLFSCEDKNAALARAHAQLPALDLDPDRLDGIVDEVNDRAAAAAQMLRLAVTQRIDLQQIAASASQALATLESSSHELTQKLQEVLLEKVRLVDELNQVNAQLQHQAITDPLTGLPNRRALNEAVERAFAQADRQAKPMSILLIDIDHFKRVNDQHGHPAGDAVLKSVAQVIKAGIRKADIAARYGGEEFATILPFTPVQGAKRVAERLREAVARLKVPWDDKVLKVTISIGGVTAGRCGADRSGQWAVQRADDALYQAKNAGRNRVVWAASGAPATAAAG